MPEKMKCPFQRNERGEFMNCFGPACMAHYEYTPVVYPPSIDTPSPVHMCRLLDKQPVPFPVPSASNTFFGR